MGHRTRELCTQTNPQLELVRDIDENFFRVNPSYGLVG